MDDYRNESIAAYLSSRGFAEVINSSFMDPNDLLKFEWNKNDPSMKPLTMENPLSSAQSILRTSLLPGMLKVIGRNAPVEQEGIRIFEMAKVFIPVSGRRKSAGRATPSGGYVYKEIIAGAMVSGTTAIGFLRHERRAGSPL